MIMASSNLQQQIQKILADAVGAPNGAPGLVFGAVNAKGDTLVAEAAGKSTLGGDQPVRVSNQLSTCYVFDPGANRTDNDRLVLRALQRDKVHHGYCVRASSRAFEAIITVG